MLRDSPSFLGKALTTSSGALNTTEESPFLEIKCVNSLVANGPANGIAQ